uniref:SMK-1 domain-containing protein n=1 Tax=Caenorhabditis japonica TaxID=281687 RepID=A0A8R1HW38_CAEJA
MSDTSGAPDDPKLNGIGSHVSANQEKDTELDVKMEVVTAETASDEVEEKQDAQEMDVPEKDDETLGVKEEIREEENHLDEEKNETKRTENAEEEKEEQTEKYSESFKKEIKENDDEDDVDDVERKKEEEEEEVGEQNGGLTKKKESPKRKEKIEKEGKENSPSEKLTNRDHILDHIDFKRDATNRVKLYVLCDQRIWEDRGTGHVVTYHLTPEDGSPSNAGNTMVLVRLEGHNKNMLESRILMDTVYQKQQETLIVWSETDVMDLALSFQEKSGCEELWQKICEVQGRDPGDADATYDDGDDSDVGELHPTASRLSLPPIEIGRLSELDALLHMHLSSNNGREKMTNAIENDNVVHKLCEVFRMCEDIEHTEGLRTFYSIVKNLFMLNRNVVIEMLLDDRYIKEVIGMFEFDPAYKHPRNHREFVYKKAKFRHVVNISSEELRDKIHRLYRAQYIQDACLPSLGLFEENLLSTLGSHIFFCRVDIVSMLQKDKKAMRELFGQLKCAETEVLRRRDLALFLKEMISLSTSIPTNGPATTKETFFKLQLQNMFSNDIMDSLEPCFSSPDHETRAVMVDVLKTMVDSNAQMVRDFLLKQAKEKSANADVLMNKMISHLLTDIDVHLTSGSELIMIMKTLLDPETMTTVKSERSDFLHLFYQRCLDTLLKPLLDNVNGGIIKRDDYVSANRLSVILRFLTFCVEHHSFSMRQRCVSNDLLNKALVLLKSKHAFLVLSSLKMLQKVVSVKDEKYIRYIVREKVLDPVMDCFRKNCNRYNVVNSAVLHLFDYVKSEDIRPLIKYVVENHMDIIDSVNYVKTFKEIKIRYDQHRDREETMSVRSEDNSSLASPRSVRKDRNEDQWFDEDEDLEVGTMMESIEKDSATVSPKKEENGQRKTGMEPMFPSLLKRKNAFDEDEAPVFGGGSAIVLNHTEKKIVIKVNNDRSSPHTPSPNSSPRASSSPGPSRDDEVTSSMNSATKETSPAPTVKSLVDYDESDDSDDELPSPDAVPSSSTGSPESDKEKTPTDGKKVNSPDYNDVSSTSNEEKEENRAMTAVIANGETPIPSGGELSRKRTSDGLDPTDVKRSRKDETNENAAATATVSQA